MGFHVNAEQFDTWLTEQQKTHEIYAPKCFPGGNNFSDVDCIRYGKVSSVLEGYRILRRDHHAGRMLGKAPDPNHY